MNKTLPYLIILFCIISSSNGMGQTFRYIPQGSILHKTYYTIPSDAEKDKLTVNSIQALANRQSDIFNDIGYSFAGIDLQYNRSRIRVSAENFREGEFISLSNAYIAYGIHIKLSDKYSLGTEFDLGLASISLGDATVSDYGGDMEFDAKCKLLAYSSNQHLEITLNHITRPELTPLYSTVNYPLGLDLFYAYNYSVGQKLKGKAFLYHEYKYKKHELSLGNTFLYKDLGGLGMVIQSTGDFAVTGELSLYRQANNTLKLMVAYEIQSFFKQSYNTTSLIEIGIRIERER